VGNESALQSPTVVVLLFDKPFRLSRQQCYRVHCNVNSWVQHSSACLLFVTNASGRAYNSHGVPIKKCLLLPDEAALISALQRPNALAIQCLRPMNVDDLGKLSWILNLHREETGVPALPSMPSCVVQQRVEREIIWFCHCTKTIEPPAIEPRPIEPRAVQRLIPECPVCLELPSQYVALVPCGHAIYCSRCAETLRKCALCRTPIQKRLDIFQ
jgi:hypothetical protein